MRKTLRTSILAMLIIFSIVYGAQSSQAEDKSQTPEAAPQNNAGPALDDTLKFVKEKINALKGFKYSGDATMVIESTSFDVGSDYMVTIKQKRVDMDSSNSSWFMESSKNWITMQAVCDLKSLYSAKVTDSNLVLFFDDNCKVFTFSKDGDPGNPEHRPIVRIDTGDADLARRLEKAFKHAAPLLEKLPKRQSGELF